MNCKRIIILTALFGFSAIGWAADGDVVAVAKKKADHGIRVGIRNSPGISDFEEEGVIDPHKESLDSEDGVQVDVMYVRRHLGSDGSSPAGPIWGAGIFISSSSGKDSGGGEYELNAFGAIGEGGVAIQLGKVAVLEILPFLGIGGAAQDMPGTVNTGSGPYLMYGVKGGVFFHLGDRVELGLEAGYSGFTSSGEIEYAGGSGLNADITFEGGGFQGGGVFVIKF